MLGVCPQTDFNFGALTVEENLKVFAAIKGIKRKEIDNEVQKILKTLNIENISKSYANSLSGGQKRKLSLAIAILGDPQILLLDDPTAGMDPCSRHYVWSFLKGRKPDQVTVISTQFMDEADILADQKAVISHGTLKCLGSSLFLKSKWGIGYKLSMYVNESCDVDKVTSLIKLHIPKAELEQRHEAEVIYSLPFENISIFPGLFSSIDASIDLGIVNYGVSITTLESVFLRLEGESDIEQADYSVFNQEQLEEEKHGGCQDDLQEGLLSFSESNISAVTGMALWRQQVCAIAKLHWLNLKHERKKLRNVLALILIPLFSTITYIITRDTSTSMQLSPGLVLLQNGVMPKHYHTKLLLQNSTDSSIDDILNILDNQGISTELFTGDDILSAIPHNAALNIMANKTSRFQAVFSRNVIHSLPVLISIVSNLLCIKLNCSDTIHTWSEPFERYRETQEQFVILHLTSVILFGIAPQFTMDNIRDRKVAAHSQMFISGLFPSAYWCGQSLMDIPLYFGLTTFTTGIILSTFYPVTYSFGSICMLIIFLFTQSTAIVFLCYLLSCQLNKSRDFWSFIFILFSGVPSFIDVPLYYDVSLLLVPTVSAYIHFVDSWHWTHIYPEMSYGRWRDIGSLIYFIISIVFLLILNCIERRCGKQVMTTDPIFRISPRKRKAISNTAELDDEDEDVQEERIKATSDLTSQDHEERPNIAVQNLRKEYIERKLCCVKGKKKTAVKNVSFCVNKGEVLGLLGPNGAGKTTTMFMITGETVPSAGKVVMNDELLRYIGYCPQINPLWPFHTVKEHLEIYAAIKGLRKEDAMETIKRVGNTLELKEHFQSPTNKLSAGIKRKLSFALSMLGDPHVMLLDEPSTSMDPKGKQRVWRSIRAALMNKQRAAVLTTHCMEEAEAVCDRVAIVVSGKLRCIGSIQHLKSKYGKGYVLEIKLKEVVAEEQKDLYNAVLQMFPHAEHQERLASHMLFKIPMEDVKSLAQSFSMLEEAKQQFDIKEYSFSQATLEQVFIECVKEQEQDNAGMALNTNFQWKRFE
ncbi:cholesterol transporter ABCA5-like [Protopterus annectens]|uniref:cholesterol transporter ABCA5-like n=1 Tax=Protopterus annectens TaxID=7888 RepID=UPI001CFACA89|nr:cholesterol transporter ABCA5-like [Protopterus annectens]